MSKARLITLIIVVFLLFLPVLLSAATFKLPDTGQTKCYQAVEPWSEIPCEGTGQDGAYSINPMSFTDNGNGTVTDNNTGLMWQKEDDGNVYNWYEASGTYDATYNPSSQDVCGSLNLGGYSDWRLPSNKELISILNYGISEPGPTIDMTYFPNTKSEAYWTSTTDINDSSYAWWISFWGGNFATHSGGFHGKSDYFHVRCVCGNRLQFGNFTDNSNGTVTDNSTGLMWQQGEVSIMTWNTAIAHCESSTLAGHSDWRLPNIKELESIADESRYGPAINTTYFPYQQGYFYISSTTFVGPKWGVEGVSFWFGGENGYTSKSGSWYVRCVRGGQFGSFGNLDHFDVTDPAGNPITDKAVNEQFPIKLTARNADGIVKTDCAGEVTLSSANGDISPVKWPLTQGGTTSVQVKIGSPGSGLWITAIGCGLTGSSEMFNVGDSAACYGHIAGSVLDGGTGADVPGATVYLDTTDNFIVANSFGRFQFSGVPSGYHTLWAEHDGKKSRKQSGYHACNSFDTEDLRLFAECNPAGKTPVLLVPGIMGSTWKKNRIEEIPTLPRYSSPDPGDKNLIIYDTKTGTDMGWKALKDELNDRGYEENCTLFDVPYDWRMHIDAAADKYLRYWIDKAKTESGAPKVNVIAHSQGGLVTRAYIQNGGNDVDRFAMIGTPNHGSAKPYYLWEGGDPISLDAAEIGFTYTLVTTYLVYGPTYMQIAATFPALLLSTIPGYNDQVFNYMHNNVPSMKQLMGTYAFLDPHGETQCEQNDWLDRLNADGDISKLTHENDSSPDKVRTKIFYSDDESTLYRIKVGSRSCSRQFYPDGRPKLLNTTFQYSGDGTVLSSSARLTESGATHATPEAGQHSKLIKTFASEAAAFINSGQSMASMVYRTTDKTSQATTSTSSLSIIFSGRVHPLVTVPSGQKSGIENSVYVKDIPLSTVSVGMDAGSISVESPADGIYTLSVSSLYPEDFSFAIEYVDSSGESTILSAHAFGHMNITSFTFTVNSGSADKIVVNKIPIPPTNLQAAPIDSGGLTTGLVWDLSTDSGVTGYNIYSKYDDEPYLSQIGTSTFNSFDTGHVWAENSSIKTRIYAVSAVKADGTESFLSDMVQNNDRDHDGLTDEQEASYGTAVNNPDSDSDGLKDGEEYVRGTNPLIVDTDGDGYSDYAEIQAGSDPLDVNSIPCTTPPSTPSLISPSDGESNVSITPTLDWSDVSGATSYNVQICSDSNCSSIVKSVFNVTNSQRTISPSLNLGTIYYWRVRAKNSCGFSPWSSVWSFTTFFVKPPSQVRAKAISSTQIALNWIDNSDNETGFKIERKEGACDSANTWKQIAKKGANVTTHTSGGLTPDTTYSYQVRAYNADNNSVYSNCVSAKTALSGTSKAPTNLKAMSVSSSKVNLSWKDNSLDETSFKVYRKVGTGSWTLLFTTYAEAVSYSDTTASGNTLTDIYSYYVKACNGSGCSPATNIAVVPYSPMNLVVEASAGKVDLTWGDKSNNETGFQIYRKSSACSYTNSWGLITTTGPNITSYSNTGLSSGKTYSYKVRSYKKSSAQPYAYGYSMFSNCSSATTP